VTRVRHWHLCRVSFDPVGAVTHPTQREADATASAYLRRRLNREFAERLIAQLPGNSVQLGEEDYLAVRPCAGRCEVLS